jgi:ribosome-associated heat shock protein Hsp15
VAPGNVVTIMIGERVRVLRIVALPQRRGPPEDAQRCFEELSPAQTIDAGAQ